MSDMNLVYFKTPLGEMALAEEGGKITRLYLCAQDVPAGMGQEPTPVLQEAARQLGEYFGGTRKVFDLPIQPRGTAFQQSVWRALCDIPYGQTRSYAHLAEQIGRPKACRAVGMANHKNPIPILIPCHRVVGADGSLTGYAGGMGMKKALLDLENKYK